MSISRAIALLFFLLGVHSVVAQRGKDPSEVLRNKQLLADSVSTAKQRPQAPAREPKAEATEEEEFVKVKDTTNYPLLTELHFLADYGKLLTLPSGFETKAEGGLQVLFENRYLLSFSYGYGSINPSNAYANGNYNAKGTWLKPGVFYQLSINPKNKLQLGGQLGLAAFEDAGTTTIESGSGLFDPYEQDFARSGLSASWWEASVQSEGNLKGNFWWGFRASLRRLLSYDEQPTPDVLLVPGYGKTINPSVMAVNLYIKYKISFFKAPQPAGSAP